VVRYRDRDKLNLTWTNLVLKPGKATRSDREEARRVLGKGATATTTPEAPSSAAEARPSAVEEAHP
jgi:hypothetical protein